LKFPSLYIGARPIFPILTLSILNLLQNYFQGGSTLF
jgi:hypothetical protein